jgi:hypothetical protein
MWCELRGDPMMDACHAYGTLSEGASCTTLDSCVASSQCAHVGAESASLAPADLLTGARCARVCARDAPTCATSQRCLDIADGVGGTRLDFGLCAP